MPSESATRRHSPRSFDGGDDADSTAANGCGVRYRGAVEDIAVFPRHLGDDDATASRPGASRNNAGGVSTIAICHDDDQSLPHSTVGYAEDDGDDDDDDPGFDGGNATAVLALTTNGPPWQHGAGAGGTASCGDSVIELFESTARSGYVNNGSFMDDDGDGDDAFAGSFVRLPPQRSPANATPKHVPGRPPRSTPKQRGVTTS
jgi:hypothetical protein